MRAAPVSLKGDDPPITPEATLAIHIIKQALIDSRTRHPPGLADLARGWLRNGASLYFWTHVAGFDDPPQLIARINAALRHHGKTDA